MFQVRGFTRGFRCGLSSLSLFVTTVPQSVFKPLLSEAEELLPENPDDAPYVALELKLGCPIWSQDSRLGLQSRVKVFSTRKLLELLSKIER